MGKAWLTKYKETCRDILALIAICIVSFALGWYTRGLYEGHRIRAIVWEAIEALPEPEQCALCGEGERYHAPCLVDLFTGQIGEMTVYTQHPSLQGEIAPMEAQQTGKLDFHPCAGLMAVRDTDAHTCQVTLPTQKWLMNPAHFCWRCRRILAKAESTGYVIVDLYDLDYIRAYPIRDTVIRDYRISVRERGDGVLDLRVTGLL